MIDKLGLNETRTSNETDPIFISKEIDTETNNEGPQKDSD